MNDPVQRLSLAASVIFLVLSGYMGLSRCMRQLVAATVGNGNLTECNLGPSVSTIHAV